ncbi:SpoIIE family protein phosphatase [Nonomuraea sp. NPDC050310]|uniref:PP2C family protein-serine/threonine phosphatase n=1 Tax=unclassified Nonomuraea TaxID=2593643 RepID=UPI0033D714C0
MTEPIGASALEHAVEELAERVNSLRAAKSAYPRDLAPTLEAALAELDTAMELLEAAHEELRKGQSGRKGGGGGQRELKLLRQVYRAFPVPVVVLDGGGVVRRVNPETTRLLGSPDGYLVGRAFPLLVDVSRRAAFRSHLTSVLQTGQTTAFESRLAHQGRAHRVRLALTRLTMPGEPQQMVAVVALPLEVEPPAPPSAEHAPEQAELLVAAARRQDLLSRLAQLLLDADSLSQPVALARASRLLSTELADWVIADLVRDGRLRRATVVPPRDQPPGGLLRTVEQASPVYRVLERGSGEVHEMVEDETLLGVSEDGPLLAVMEAGSMVSAPIGDGEGVLTLVRSSGRPPFTLADLGLVEEVGRQLGLALRAQQTFASRARAADALSSSVVPRALPDVPGFEAAAIYHPGASVGAEFYDVFPVSDGWGFALGGAVGRGQEAASVSAMVRGGLRVLSVWEPEPAEAVRKVNEALVAQGTGMFVMALAGYVSGRRIRLASAGHHPAALVQPDGTVRFLAGGGMPLGISPEAGTAVEELTLSHGQLLVFYSEGLLSSRDASGQPYGEDRLADALARCVGQAPSTVVKALEEDRAAFSGGQVWDEIVVLALRAV